MEYTVLTGDLVASSRLTKTQVDHVMTDLEGAADEVQRWSDLPFGFARQSGDGWQMALGQPQLGLRAALFLISQLRAKHPEIETRIALAEGEGTLAPDLNSASGPAFTASGRLLGKMTKNIRLDHAAGGAKAATLALTDQITQSWTQAQAQALSYALHPTAPPRSEIAATLGISREAVNQRLWGGGFPALERALSAWENPEGNQ
jgi:hypothetical protein